MKKISPMKTLKGPERVMYDNLLGMGHTPASAWKFLMNRRKLVKERDALADKRVRQQAAVTPMDYRGRGA